MEYRVLQSIEELEEAAHLEVAVWGVDPRDAVPMHIMRPMGLYGGVVIGAFDGGRMIGVSLAFPARQDNHLFLWSQMTGVHPDFQRQGVGIGLKQAQRAWAIDHGYEEIRWTFDPLLRGNANFNICRLGATSSTYYVNFYGLMRDSVNPSVPSDRLEAVWRLSDARVRQILDGQATKPASSSYNHNHFLLVVNANASPQRQPVHDAALGSAFVQIPRDLAEIEQHSPDLLLEWRIALRETLQQAFELGYRVVDFVESDGRCWYVLRAQAHCILYVLLCADGSLYTGVTSNLRQRVAQHNAGRAAAYTRARRPVRLVGAWRFVDRSSALKAEIAFKALPRTAKLEHIRRKLPYQKAPYFDIHEL